ncbi:MAG: type IV toxin-antitoxin system AbiEi family antitoxin domain-containing protein [Actinomycetota bacterium]
MKSDERVHSYKETPEGRCAAMAARQYGVITRGQALSFGLSPSALGRRLASGRLQPIHPGIYLLTGTRGTWEQRLLAACLWAHGVASHRAAAALWGLGIDRRETVEITSSRRLRRAGLLVHVGRLTSADTTSFGRIPVTTIPKTLLDMGAVQDREVVEAAVTEAIRKGRTSGDKLKAFLSDKGGKGRRGSKMLGSIVESIGDSRVESVLELKLKRLLGRHGLPEPLTQYTIRNAGSFVARVDLAYPEIRLAIEADGYRYHSGRDSWKRDLARRNVLTGLGWHVVHATWDDVTKRPHNLLDQIRNAMGLLALDVHDGAPG